MQNPYHGTNPPIFRVAELRGREKLWSELDNHVRNRRSIVLMGAEGLGKSSLLNCYFDRESRERAALEERILIRVTDFPTDRDPDGIYQYLAEGVLRSVDALDQDETADVYRRLYRKCSEQMERSKDPASRFEQICETIRNEDYQVMLVIDGFERFVSSPNVKMEHHDLMNTLISKNLIFVVATNYDFNKVSLPTLVSGSFLLMKFSGNEVVLKGLSEQSCAEVLRPNDFTEAEIHQLWILSGGNPSLLRRAAEHAFDAKQAGAIDWDAVLRNTYVDVSDLLGRWCRLLTVPQVRVLKALAAEKLNAHLSFQDSVLAEAAESLIKRGLLSCPLRAGSLQEIKGLYRFSTPLLRKYCREHSIQAEPMSTYQVKQAADHLADTLEDPSATVDTLVQRTEELEKVTGNVSPASFSAPPSEELLQEFELNSSVFGRFHPDVQVFLSHGIRVERAFAGSDMMDYSSSYIYFAKAVEAHLNDTLVPLLRAVFPEETVNIDGRIYQLRDLEHMMLGQIKWVLNKTYQGTGGSLLANLGVYCSQKLKRFPENWWRKFVKDLNFIRESRNDIPHTSFFSADEGKKFLSCMFSGEKSFFLRCLELYEAAVGGGVLKN